jgi:hypothetical protein
MTYYTFGLPNPFNTLNSVYEFKIIDKHIYIPGNYIGRDEVGEPNSAEQATWLNSLNKQLSIKEVWYGTWELATEQDVEKFVTILKEHNILLTFSIDYEISGYFDKDEQGWCSDRLSLWCENGKNVKIRSYFDANGIIRSDSTQNGIIERKENNLLFIRYESTNHVVIFNLETKKLR